LATADRRELHEILAFAGQRVKLAARLLLGDLFLLQLQPRTFQIGFDCRDVCFGGFARAHRTFVGGDEQPQILPALDELTERARRNQRVDVREVAVFIHVDQSSLEQVVV